MNMGLVFWSKTCVSYRCAWMVCFAALSFQAFAFQSSSEDENSNLVYEILETEVGDEWIIVDSGNTEDGDGGQKDDTTNIDTRGKRERHFGFGLAQAGSTRYLFYPQGTDVWFQSLKPQQSWVVSKPEGVFSLKRVFANDDGRAWLIGSFKQSLTWYNHAVESTGKDDLFVAQVNADGAIAWLRRIGSEGDDALAHAQLNQASELLLDIRSQRTSALDANEGLSVSGTDAFSMVLDMSGKMRWVERNN